jgi:hypothetical protein
MTMGATSKPLSILTVPRWTIAAVYTLVLFGTPLLQSVHAKKKSFSPGDLCLKQRSNEGPGFPVQVLQSGVPIRDVNGNEYDLSKLKPFVDLFSKNTFSPSSDNTLVVDKRTDEVIRVSVYKAVFEDGSTVLVEKDENNNIAYVEVRRRAKEEDTFLVPKEDGQTDEFLAYTNADIDFELLQSQYRYAEASHPEGERHLRRRMENEIIDEHLAPNLQYRQERAEFEASSFTSFGFGVCSSYTLINLAIVFDGDFCSIYGSFEAARRRILTIVASASFHYERDMCVQLRLTDISKWFTKWVPSGWIFHTALPHKILVAHSPVDSNP